MSTIAAILSKEPRPLKEVAPQTPRDLDRIVARCMRKEPDQRFQSAVDLRLALEDVQGNTGGDTTPSIAVLPFTNLSPDKENEYFSDGLAEEIIDALSHVPGLRVAARSSAFSFRGKEVELSQIGRKLSVEHVLEGSVRKASNRIRVTTQLVKAFDGFQVWSGRYDREMTDVFAV
jgi:TolB-like protein